MTFSFWSDEHAEIRDFYQNDLAQVIAAVRHNAETTDPDSKLGNKVIKLFHRHISKSYDVPLNWDFLDLNQAHELAKRLGIPVKENYKYVSAADLMSVEVIRSRIPGRTLMECWPSLRWRHVVVLACKLKLYISRMRRLTRKTAGSVVHGEDCSPWLEGDWNGVPLHATLTEYAAILNFWINFVSDEESLEGEEEGDAAQLKASSCEGPIPLGNIEAEKHFVFTNNSLTPDNLMIGNGILSQYDLYLIKWDRAGYYPPGFEQKSMLLFDAPDSWSAYDRRRWTSFTNFVTGYRPGWGSQGLGKVFTNIRDSTGIGRTNSVLKGFTENKYRQGRSRYSMTQLDLIEGDVFA